MRLVRLIGLFSGLCQQLFFAYICLIFTATKVYKGNNTGNQHCKTKQHLNNIPCTKRAGIPS